MRRSPHERGRGGYSLISCLTYWRYKKLIKQNKQMSSGLFFKKLCDVTAMSAALGILAHVFLLWCMDAGGTDFLCATCIRGLHLMEARTGWSYEAINVVLFIFLEPSVIGFNILLFFFHKYYSSHLLLALESVAAFISVTYVCMYIYEAGLASTAYPS